MDAQKRVLFELKEHIAYVTLNRPERHNGLDALMFDELVSVAGKIRKDRSIRCVIIKGEGPSFCAGLDVKAMSQRPGRVLRMFARLPWRKDNHFQRAAHIWRDLPVPVIAVVHGNCFGGGMQIILACDYRFVTPDARLSIMEMRWGLIPDMSGSVTLSRLTRIDIAEELTMTGRVFSGVEGAQYGLVTRLSDEPLAAAEELAGSICEQSPDAIAAVKYLFRKTWKKDTRSALFWERMTQLRLLGRRNQRTAMKAGLAKRDGPISYVDRSTFR